MGIRCNVRGGGGSGDGSRGGKMASSGLAPLFMVTGQLVASFAGASFISLILCFSVPIFCFR